MRLCSGQLGRQGFTLLELMVVLTLIAIMSAMIIPEMRGTYEDALLRSSTRDVICVMNLASSRAAALGQTHRVRTDEESGRYVIERCVRDMGTESEFVPVKDLLGTAGEIDRRISIQIVRPGQELPEESAEQEEVAVHSGAVRFFADGTADARLIILTDRMGFRTTLRVNPATGRVRPFEPKPE